MGVTLKSTHVVTPAEPTWQGILPLSELDQVGVVTHTPVLYFYNRPTNDEWLDPSKNKVIHTLKDSLSRALVHFYPLAGRLRWVEGNRLELDCNAMGAEIVEAESSDKITMFGDFVDSSKSMFRDLLVHLDYENTPIQDIPVLSLQVTRFACGGICLGIQSSHVITDGRCAFHFCKEWARLARGEPLEVAPFLDRLALKHTTTMVGPSVNDKDNIDPNLPLAQLADSKSRDEPQDDTPEPSLPKLVVMTAAQIESLKKVANQQQAAGTKGRPYSRFEVITAHVWRCMTLDSNPEPNQIMDLYIIADGRSRLDPPLPSSYFGNSIAPVKTSSSAGELMSKPLSYACGKVREAINQMSNEYLRGTIGLLGNEKSLINYQVKEDRGDMVGSVKQGFDIWVSCWLNILAHGLDFGWGNEIYAGPPTGLGSGRNVYILPHYPIDGSLKLAFGSKL